MKRLIPYQYQRQNALPLTDDSVFSTIAEMNDYLSSGNRYAGQTVTCLEDDGIYVLNSARNFWLPKSGDGNITSWNLDGGNSDSIYTETLIINGGNSTN